MSTILESFAQSGCKLIEILSRLLEQSFLKNRAVLSLCRAAVDLRPSLQTRDKIVVDIADMQTGHLPIPTKFW